MRAVHDNKGTLTYACFANFFSIKKFLKDKNAEGHHITTTKEDVAEWLRTWDTSTMFEATVCGRS